jgi:acyl-CoA thioesterase I
MTWRLLGRFAPVALRVALGVALAASFTSVSSSGAAPAEQAGAEQPACSVPHDIGETAPNLPNLAAAIHSKKPVRIVVIGGGSTKGAAAGPPENAYPSRLQAALQKRFPNVPITVVNLGMPRQTAHQMIERFPGDVSEDEPALIIWEVGTSDAVRGVDLDDFTAALQAGIDLTKNRAIDLMLVDMQFSRKATTIIDFDHYLDAIRSVSEMNGVFVFPRFAIMRHWSEENVFDYDDVPESGRARLAAQVYDCLGRALAEAIAKAVQ